MTITTRDLVRLSRQWHEVLARVENESVPLSVAKQSLQDLIEGHFEEPSRVPYWYLNPEQQLENVRRWNKNRGWGFVDSDFPKIPDGLVPSSSLCVPVLAVYLPDKGQGKDREPGYIRTASELWEIARKNQPESWQGHRLCINAANLRLLSGTDKAHKPGIRWVMVDLGAYWNGEDGIRPRNVRDEDSAHAEVLAAAAHFPGWVSSMNGTDIPYVWLAGYRVKPPMESDWTDVPILSMYPADCKVCLDARFDASLHNAHNCSYAIPVRREL